MENNFYKKLVMENSISEKELCKMLNVDSAELYHMFIFFALPAFFYNGQIRGVKKLIDIWLDHQTKNTELK